MSARDSDAARVAARIADGSAIDWAIAETEADPADRALVDELRAIADIATLHRTPSAPVDDEAPARETWGPLTLLQPIGTGRFGDVYLAWDARLQRRVALKLLRVASSSLASPMRAIDEARLLARVRHPNVLTVYGAEYLDDQVGIWTEFIEGQTLEARLAGLGRLDAEEVVDVGVALARALAAVHAAGLLHRDIKAQNVMRETGGRIVLMDFGAGHDLALAPARDGDLTGTPLYLAPEVLAGGAASASSDVYALGVLLFHLLTGTHPVPGGTLDEVRAGHNGAARQRLRDLRPDLSPSLVDALERATAPQPGDRYSEASTLAAALEATRSRGVPHAIATRQAERRTSYRFIGITAVAAGAVFAAATFMWTAARAWPDTLDAPPPMPTGVGPSAAEARPEIDGAILLIGRPSRNGRLLPYAGIEGDVWLWDSARGTAERIIDLPSGESAGYTLASPDGTQVAYTVTSPDRSTMRVAKADGTDARVLVPAEAASEPEPLDWSLDGRILVLFRQSDGTALLTLVNDRGGASVVREFAGGAVPRNASLSQDGQFVVYDQPRATDPGKRDLLIARSDGTDERTLLPGPASHLMPLWTPGGRGVFFVSDRAGSIDGWTVPVEGGVATGPPVLVAQHLNHVLPLGLTDAGRFYFLLRKNQVDVYTVGVDGGTALPETRARLSPSEAGGHIAPAWSPHGDLISYLTISYATVLGVDSHLLTTQNIATGRRRLVPVDMNRLGLMAPRWSPDGTRILVRGEGRNGQAGYWHVDLATGAATPILAFDQVSDYGAFAWAPDGQRIFYLHAPRGLIARDLRDGRETVVVGRNARVPRWSLLVSPDGTRIAFTTHAVPGRASFIEIVTLDGDQRRDVIAFDHPAAAAILHGWTPDDRLIYTTGLGGSDLPARVWSIAASGGSPHDMRLSVNGNVRENKMALSPDGRVLAYNDGFVSRELWVMDNFLPERAGP